MPTFRKRCAVIKPKPKKKHAVSDRISNSVAWGPEPKWADKPTVEADVSFAMTWYNYMSGPAEQMKWTLEYLETTNQPKSFIKQISQIRDAEIYPTGSICRMLSRGAKLPDKMLIRALGKLNELIKQGHFAAKAEPKPPKMPAFMGIMSENAMGLVENILERIHKGKIKSAGAISFSWAEKLTPAQLRPIIKDCREWAGELRIAQAGTDDQLAEAYQHFSPLAKKVAISFLDKVASLKPAVAMRPKTPPRPERVVAKLLFSPHDEETGVSSIDPEELVGATQLWVYNSRTRKMGVYYASNGEGLTAHRTTMQGYNPSTSTMKVLRHPKEMLSQFMRQPSAKANQFYDKLKTVGKPINDRINRDTVLLKAVRP